VQGTKNDDVQKSEIYVCANDLQSIEAIAQGGVQVGAHRILKEKNVESGLQVNLGLEGLKMIRLWDSEDQELKEPDHMVGLK
jgi:uncharacterized protein YpmB